MIDFKNRQSNWKSKRHLKRSRANGQDTLYLLTAGLLFSGFFMNHIKPSNYTPLITTQTVINQAQAKEKIIPSSTPTPSMYIDVRIKIVSDYLTDNGSKDILAPYAEEFVQMADKYGLSYTLMPAIAGKESGFGRYMVPGSFNPFGIGGTSLIYFKSFTDAIAYEANLLSSNYRYEANSGIGYKYCPPSECATNWVSTVTQFENDMLARGNK